MVHDPYKVLGVPENATQDEIKKAYKKKAKEYHPDLHPNDPVAAQKMGELNEAYDMLMNPEKYAQHRRQQEQNSQRGYSGYSGQQRQDGQSSYQGPGGWSSDFGGFDFGDIFGFGGFYGDGGWSRPQVHSDDSTEFRRAVEAINQRQYQEAVHILNSVVSTGRNGRWYYLIALANHGAGNEVMALDQIHRAIQIEPNNTEYRQVLQQFQQAGNVYQQNTRGFTTTPSEVQKMCLGMCAAQLFCRCCCI